MADLTTNNELNNYSKLIRLTVPIATSFIDRNFINFYENSKILETISLSQNQID